ncbi:MAG TPA: hypothetical protein VGI74_24385 [Streptosporangiaceae bacterium]|jgi:Tfp pilus assembly protein FimV
MTRPPRHTSDDVMQRISAALNTMASDPQAPRTKREIERRTQLSHDTIARAFRQDTTMPSPWNLTARLTSLGERPARRTDPQTHQIRELQAKIKDKNKQIAQLQTTLDRHAMTVLALHLELQQLPGPNSNVVAITSNRRHTSKD